jgi:soluble lytic murein transglycosylase-like protein
MLERLSATLARIGEIELRFRSENTGGIVSVAPHYSNMTSRPSQSSSLQPFFPKYLLKAATEKVASNVSAMSAYDDLIESIAAKHGVDSALVKAVIQAESGFNKDAISASGAMGLMQLMPGTARALGVGDPYDPAQNIEGGVRYLKSQIDRFGSIELALAAYNAGPARVMKYGGIPPFAQTQRYVQKVMSYREAYAAR